ncbi:MAG TPA: hypothetical protein VE781_13795 [Kineosporiaceae bacterium]|jgi:hypothetical protein|nr:hypothetical protein [Kineosporiaceae bacterium]
MSSWEDVTTFEQLQGMTPQERSQLFDDALVMDLRHLTAAERERVQALQVRLDERSRVREAEARGKAS